MAKKGKKLCIVCKKNPATVPDRNKPGAWRAEVCGPCHSGRLVGDLENVMRHFGYPVPPDDKPKA